MQGLNNAELKKAFNEYKAKAEDNADFIIIGLLTLIALLLVINVCIEASKLRRVRAMDNRLDYMAELEDAYLDCDCDDCDYDFGIDEVDDGHIKIN
jgi:hypothetical protein